MQPSLSIIFTYINVLRAEVLDTLTLRVKGRNRNLVKVSKAYPIFHRLRFTLIELAIGGMFPLAVYAQTTVIVRRTPTEIVIGADSLETTDHFTIDNLGKRKTWVTFSYVCKIIRVGNRAIGFSGLTGGSDAVPIDYAAIATNALNEGKDIVTTANALTSVFGSLLRQALEQVRHSDIQSYRDATISKKTGKTKSSLEILAIAVERNVPILAYMEFQVANAETEPVELMPITIGVCPSRSCPIEATVVGGFHDEIDAARKNGAFWRRYGNAGGISHLIEIMEKRRSDVVGGPIDVLRVTARGDVEWIGKAPQCDAQGKRVPQPKNPAP